MPLFNVSSALDAATIQQAPDQLKPHISAMYCMDETQLLEELIPLVTPTQELLDKTTRESAALVRAVRERDDAMHMIDALLLEYSLDTREGVLLMCLAEALMRIPDSATADALIKDKLTIADWKMHLKQSKSLLVNASTWGLLLTGKVITLDAGIEDEPASIINRLVNRLSEPVVRQAMHQAMKIMGKQFVLGRTISEALTNSRKNREAGYTYSYDMLGEAALTGQDAEHYFQAYSRAIQAVGKDTFPADKSPRPTISIKLSALHPRYEKSQEQRVMSELRERMLALIEMARELDVGITIDAEEADRLELSLNLFERLYREGISRGWGNLGLVVQAYSKRALPVLCWLAALANAQGDPIPVRLVKGAYWDSEIKHAQQLGLEGYPVFTRKEATDVSYLVCARFLLSEQVRGRLYPQFASHNAHTVASVISMASHNEYEFQRLHGMGDALYNTVMERYNCHVRIYAPVGSHKDLLPYLVRRLLENGANSSFVHRLIDQKTPVESLTEHPVTQLCRYATLANERIPLPEHIYSQGRVNSRGVNINVDDQWLPLQREVQAFFSHSWHAAPVINGQRIEIGELRQVHAPFDRVIHVGSLFEADAQTTEQAIAAAHGAFAGWNATPVEKRAEALERAAELLESHRAELIALCHLEAGKAIQDGIDEVREAVDFCRYYAQQARQLFGSALTLDGPTGESNELYLQGRGVFVCISPWNFPLAIFTGQIMAALAAGNCVIAKPAEQTSLIAARAVALFHQAGIPGRVLQLLPGAGSRIGPLLTADERITGVAFTGSTETARLINRSLAERNGPIATLVAETGGQNAMIVDSTALPEQVIKDVISSAFTSAGQRCSALRVLFIQEDVAGRMLELLKGAMAELKVGNPCELDTDVGPVIDDAARRALQQHIAEMREQASLIAEAPLPLNAEAGSFVAPVAFEIAGMGQLDKEHFGPILHVIRYPASRLDDVIAQINDSGYGLTLGIHSRNETTSRRIDTKVRVGNVYINRNQIGAVVGVQPFGGLGLSGTGPKAGGPHYLLRFATERTRTINTTAIGGNATLLSLENSVIR
ncbi:bifunctional proline dehydrogenase/L-glutamate gamma-semialdehyde dehydrogenase PutA [Sedimenticola hydrogenitrophicus]|uniref:bifunctional proline dehydrogenase/L-glutamate gamma-semialdehyde dehydrogenase PutA n=1 Tax=Sedimenticola hydrogenitrophicus TaxID=2967975 RepID=UPI0023B10A0E|nr:bifunctional proline dehydrogenase/L-glutamate gamma-semialdehyde dehydrogenase PutA [Sedimenticola hydrogenitrophicus]